MSDPAHWSSVSQSPSHLLHLMDDLQPMLSALPSKPPRPLSTIGSIDSVCDPIPVRPFKNAVTTPFPSRQQAI